MELGNEIMKFSPAGKDYAMGKKDDNWAEMKYNKENIDSFAE